MPCSFGSLGSRGNGTKILSSYNINTLLTWFRMQSKTSVYRTSNYPCIHKTITMLAQPIHVILTGEKSEVISPIRSMRKCWSSSIIHTKPHYWSAWEPELSCPIASVVLCLFSPKGRYIMALFNERHQVNGRFPKLQQKGTLTHVIIIEITWVKGNSITISLGNYSKYS